MRKVGPEFGQSGGMKRKGGMQDNSNVHMREAGQEGAGYRVEGRQDRRKQDTG